MYRDSLAEELEVLKKLDHPNLVKTVDVYLYQKRAYLVQEHLDGALLLDQMDKI
jgi:serine/threonine protein kinase